MLMSSGGYAASSSGCVTRPRAREIGSTVYAGPTQGSLLIGRYVMATAEHREPCDSRGSCTVLGAPGGEIPPGDSTWAAVGPAHAYFSTASVSRPAAGATDAPLESHKPKSSPFTFSLRPSLHAAKQPRRRPALSTALLRSRP